MSISTESVYVSAFLLGCTIAFSLGVYGCGQEMKKSSYMDASQEICERFGECDDLRRRLAND